jgi:2-aminobenzoate-CoA ligase
MTPSAHIDPFPRENLPPASQQPVFRFDLAGLDYPARLNACTELLDDALAAGRGDRVAIVAGGSRWTYAELSERVNRIANVLVNDLGLVPGNRVLLRSANNPMMVAAYFAVLKAGGVVVATMPLLRAKELGYILDKAAVSIALCDASLSEEIDKAAKQGPRRLSMLCWGAGGELDRLMASPGYSRFSACDTAADDVCLIAFTSGTTGQPKGTMHFHRDLLAICDTYGKHVLRAGPEDRFIGSPPLAFTFGLGGLVLFPMRVGASMILLEKAPPDELLRAIEQHRATVCFTAPTAYRAILAQLPGRDIASLRKCISAGEALPKATWEAWFEATGIRILDGIGSTEMLHIFIGSPEEDLRPGATGKPVPGYEARIVDEAGRQVPAGTPGRLAVRGPTGCRYLADARQRRYVEDGWNITGDTYVCDADGYYWYQARSDDMIVSAGYNIAGPEVEAVLLSHPAVLECGVVGSPCPDRGQIVKAFVVLRPGHDATPALTRALQDFVKAEVAPYKYPRAIDYVQSLPKTDTGKLQRFRLREMAAGTTGAKRAS